MSLRVKSAKQARLDARAEMIKQQAAVERRNRNIVIAVFAVVIVGGAVGIGFLTKSATDSSSGLAGYAVPAEGASHAQMGSPLTHKHQPPSSGNHYSQQGVAPVPWAPYRQAIPEGDWLHNLEHGGVALVYRCSATECDDFYAKAQQLSRSLPRDSKFNEVKFVSTPYPNMQPKLAVLSWGREEDLSTLDGAAILDFYQRNVDHGPESIP